jgi:hypothetical protein
VDGEGARFEAFLAAADRFNRNTELGNEQKTELADEALSFLYVAADELEALAPRRAHEPALPDPFTLKFKPS